MSLSRETQKLIEDRMKRSGYPTADDVVRVALETLEHFEAAGPDDDTWAAIDRAEAQFERGEGVPADEAFERLRRKHLDG